ncbi:folylpolyglutamate synthase, mitochondrial-like isoform X4 [Zootermopsis nevadensis]|uniref:folylpolyglutamate synthase, mitochondrial-like isoform X4 n=1 Tax=Zootermopsis nevadensis TaxID=136037 RepID=UPI000B8E7C23|nr:folylpolyglutamate synthase, mitochondrial-like isoform X4 [Zootermopsis nevadensis]
MRGLVRISRIFKKYYVTTLKSIVNFTAPGFYNYEEAVKALNSLQTNTAFIKELEKKDRHSHDSEIKKFEETIKFLERSGVSLEKLDELSVIHVSGTKGKGSTCAFCESILHHHGYKTGFYSSPHLVAVRERIRINGQPLSQSDFAKYFWNIYNSLLELRKSNNDMPSYFKFLTVMAFYVFLSEKVDVAIVEVGIGGEYDCTNILRQVSTVGITSLGIDHTNVLGNTIEEIAWQKAGIMKPGSITFTVDEQPKAALKVLKQRASEKKIEGVREEVAEENIGPNRAEVTEGIHQLAGAALTTKDGTGSEEWLPVSPTFPISSSMALGLKFCTWPGRNQIINDGLIHFFLDGAHTSESLWLCADWFIQNSQAIAKQDIPYRVLVFNCTGNRDPRALLLPLLNCGFQLVIFCPNSVTTSVDSSSDQANYMTSVTQQLEKCRSTQDVWHELQEENVKNRSSAFNGLQPLYVPNNLPINFHDSCNSFKSKAEVKLFPCMSDTLAYLKKKTEDEACKSHILVTGSLHLVGTASSVLDPDLTLATPQLSGGIGISPFSSTDVMGSCTS